MPKFFTKWFSCVSSREVDLPSEGLVMKTVDCDWMKSANQTLHRTSEYENPSLVLRRGQTFRVKVTFQRPFNTDADKVFLELAIGKDAQLVNDTKVRISLSDTLNPAKWSMKLDSTSDNSLTVEVSIPPNAIVGRYTTTIEFVSKLESGETSKSRDKEPDVIVIFNPWCKDDAVYMENEEHRQEYVLNDTGNIYRGSTRRITPKPWIFGQFEENILNTALCILDLDKRTCANSGKWLQKRRDPVWVVRAASAMCNAANDGVEGVLVGNWSGDYGGGASPLSWSGSVKILQQFYKTKKPVMFGQCWVFSGVMTTVLRSLGIPTRSVTNFASAHDTEGSMTIDKYVTEDGAEVDMGGDSVWNFHVWNESWMARPDLPKGYGGWQVIDATPQEVSLGLYQTGPAPLAAIKKGEVYLGYETPFVFAEVNSDRVTWIVKEEDDMVEIQSVGRRSGWSVGKYISTKQVGSDEREDITDQYKYKEGSPEERAAFNLAYGFGSQPDYQKGFLALQEEDTSDGIDFEFSTTPTDEELFNGDDFTVTITMKNNSSEQRTVDLTSSLQTILYTGARFRFVKRSKIDDIVLEGKASVTKEFKVVFSEYSGKLVDHSALRLLAVATVKGTKNMFSEDFEFRLDNRGDSVTVEAGDNFKVGQKSEVKVKFTNPLPVKLTHVTVTLEGTGLLEALVNKMSPIPPKGSIESTFTITPKRAGLRRLIVADVDSRQIQDLTGSIRIDVAPAPEPEVKPSAAAQDEAVETKEDAPQGEA